MRERVAFIGLGNMGAPMAARLVEKRFDVVVYDLRTEAVAAFVARHGGRAATSLADAGRSSDLVVTMLPDEKAVSTALLDSRGITSTLRPGALVIDMGTCDPAGTVSTLRELAARDIAFIDAPVMGGVALARAGTLLVVAGGAEADIERARPLFDAVGERLFHCGPVGSGHALKALANYVNACSLINLIEAMGAGQKYGLSVSVLSEALLALCTGRQHPLEKKVIPQILSRKFTAGMALGLTAKDVRIACKIAQAAGAAFPLGERVIELWQRAAAEIGLGADQTEVARLWERANGKELRADG